MKFNSLFLFIFLISFYSSGQKANDFNEIDHWETVVYASGTCHYIEGIQAPPLNWKELEFDDTKWKTGSGGFGYADNDDQTVDQKANALFLRIGFDILTIDAIGALNFHIDYDDGFVAYLNGVEIARRLMDVAVPAYNTLTTDQQEAQMYNGGLPDTFPLDDNLWRSVLKEGENQLAIEIHNSGNTSGDMSTIPFLTLGIIDDSNEHVATPAWLKAPFNFTSSNLPIVIIETDNNSPIIDEPKTKANMKIINNVSGQINHVSDTPTDYDGNIGIEIRGSYSASLPQKPFGIETRDNLEQNNNVKLLGMPKENDWILLANYNDKSFMRNTLPFHLFEKMGHYAPRTKACEVTINNEYQGIYIFTERIKIDKNRVDIATLDADDNAGDSITGGYIFKIDYTDEYSWESNFSPIDQPNGRVLFVNHDPAGDELTNDQREYLKWYVNEFESVLYSSDFDNPQSGYRSFIDVDTFIDYFIIGELSRNVDAYKKSRYLYKDKDSKGGLLCSGPVWDFDWAWKNMRDCSFLSEQDGSGWAYKINECSVRPTPPSWIVRFMQDQLFVDQLFTRYTDLRETILSEAYLQNYADSIKNLFEEPQKRHYKRWPILGRSVGAPETDFIPDTYVGEVDKMVDWIYTRLNWIDNNIEGEYLTSKSDIAFSNYLKIYPNPAKDLIRVESDVEIISLEIMNLTGAIVYEASIPGQQQYRLDLSSLKNGLYFIRVIYPEGQSQIKQIMVSD